MPRGMGGKATNPTPADYQPPPPPRGGPHLAALWSRRSDSAMGSTAGKYTKGCLWRNYLKASNTSGRPIHAARHGWEATNPTPPPPPRALYSSHRRRLAGFILPNRLAHLTYSPMSTPFRRILRPTPTKQTKKNSAGFADNFPFSAHNQLVSHPRLQTSHKQIRPPQAPQPEIVK